MQTDVSHSFSTVEFAFTIGNSALRG